MSDPVDDRDRERIRAFWARVERIVKCYTQRFSAVRTLRLLNREGVYLLVASVVLLGLVLVAAWCSVPDRWAYMLLILPGYYIADSILVNTSITFITQRPIHRLRSVLLTMLNVFNVGLAYAVAYAALREAFAQPLSLIQSIYFSFVTLATVVYGDIKPDGSRAWTGQVTVVLEIITGLYFLACVVTVVVSWAQRREEQ